MKVSDWKINVIQMDVAIGEPDKNYRQVEQNIKLAMQGHDAPDVIVLPEMWNAGYALNRIQQLADEQGIRTKELLHRLSKHYRVNIVGGSVAVKQEGQVQNVTYVYNRQGERVSEYAKIHLFKLMDEHLYLTEGDMLHRFELDGIPCGSIICYDLRFPELSRTLALSGAEVLFVPAQWPNPRLYHWKTLLAARAIENQMAVVACNRTGSSIGDNGEETTFFGHSMILDPWGEVIASAGEEALILKGTLKLESIPEVRSRISVFKDRKPHIYQLGVQE